MYNNSFILHIKYIIEVLTTLQLYCKNLYCIIKQERILGEKAVSGEENNEKYMWMGKERD